MTKNMFSCLLALLLALPPARWFAIELSEILHPQRRWYEAPEEPEGEHHVGNAASNDEDPPRDNARQERDSRGARKQDAAHVHFDKQVVPGLPLESEACRGRGGGAVTLGRRVDDKARTRSAVHAGGSQGQITQDRSTAGRQARIKGASARVLGATLSGTRYEACGGVCVWGERDKAGGPCSRCLARRW